MLNSLVRHGIVRQMGTSKVEERVMGFVEVKVNGQWMNLMHLTLRCQLCNEEIILAHVAKIENADAPVNATWTCKRCHSVNG
jgi:uncharacterized protein with PIN domain